MLDTTAAYESVRCTNGLQFDENSRSVPSPKEAAQEPTFGISVVRGSQFAQIEPLAEVVGILDDNVPTALLGSHLRRERLAIAVEFVRLQTELGDELVFTTFEFDVTPLVRLTPLSLPNVVPTIRRLPREVLRWLSASLIVEVEEDASNVLDCPTCSRYISSSRIRRDT